MCPTVHVVTAREPEQLFISIEEFPVALAELRRFLPELKNELRKKWPVESIYIEERKPRLRNPSFGSEVVPTACIGLAVVFGTAVLKAAGTKLGEAIGDGIKPYVTRWLKDRFGGPKRKTPRAKDRNTSRIKKRNGGKRD